MIYIRARYNTDISLDGVFFLSPQVIVNEEEVSQLIKATGATYEQANQAYIVSE